MPRRLRPRATQAPVGATIALGWRLACSALGRWLLVTAIVQGAVALVASPLLLALFQSVLDVAGIGGLTTTNATALLERPGSIALLVLLLLLAVLALVLQSGIVAIAADGQQSTGEVPGPRAIAAAAAHRLRALARPSTLLLVPYLLLLAPLGHAALGSVLTRWIAVPDFISGELTKSTAGTVGWIAITIVLWYLNLRLVLTVPYLVIGGRTAAEAFRASWAATRWVPWRLVAILLAVIVPAGAALLALGGVALGATALADALAPDAAPVVAAIAFAVAEVAAFFVVGVAVVIQTHAFVRIVRASENAVAAVARPSTRSARSGTDASTRSLSEERSDESKGRPRRKPAVLAGTAVALGTVAATTALAFAAIPTIDRYADGATLLIAHRGLTDHAVENTIPALEAAAAAGADLVEFDVQQTKDGDWVVMHDFELSRLTGSPGAVKDMTLEEATSLVVRAGGEEARVPSMREWIRRAKELGQALLIEIKPHGQETEDYLERFYAILDEEGVASVHLNHTMSERVLEGQKALRPEEPAGLIVPILLGGAGPDSVADFLVVEAFSYSDALRESLHDAGKALFVWTVNDEARMREYLRDGVDGVISDRLPELEAQRDAVADESGLAPKLLDALGRAVTLW